MKTVISDLQGVVMTNGAGLSGTFVENSLTVAGNVGFGTASLGAGKVIATITLTAGGTGYVNNSYAQQALTGGTGTGATADIRVVGGIVTVCVLRGGGVGYVVGDVLSCTTIGAGVGLIVTVTTVASSVASDGIVVAPRIGAGTTNPRSALDVVGSATIDGATLSVWNPTAQIVSSPSLTSLSIGSANAPAIFAQVGANTFGLRVNTLTNLSAGPGFFNVIGVYANPLINATTATTTGRVAGAIFNTTRSDPSDTSTVITIEGVAANAGVSSGIGTQTTARAVGVRASLSGNAVDHTIVLGIAVWASMTASPTNYTTASMFNCAPAIGTGSIDTYYGLRIEASTTPTITNRWGISQEDTLAKNFFAGNVGIGTTSPAYRLEVKSALIPAALSANITNKTYAEINGTDPGIVYGGDGGGLVIAPLQGRGAHVALLAVQNDSNKEGVPQFVIYTGGTRTTSTEKMRVDHNGNVGIGMTPSSAHKLDVAGKIGGSVYGDSYLEFRSNGNTTLRANNTVNIGYLDTVNVTNDGKVGIGTASPLATLSVASAIYNAPGLTNKGAVQIAFANSNGLSFGSYDASPYSTYIQGISSVSPNGVYYPISLNPVGGNVGIGTTSPASALDVAGTITCDDTGTGIKLPASPGNVDVQTLDCYQESTYTATDTSGAGLVFTVNNPAVCTRIGRLVVVRVDITYPATADTAYASLSVPFASIINGGTAAAYGGVLGTCIILANVNAFEVYASAPLTRQTNAGLSGVRLVFAICFQAS